MPSVTSFSAPRRVPLKVPLRGSFKILSFEGSIEDLFRFWWYSGCCAPLKHQFVAATKVGLSALCCSGSSVLLGAADVPPLKANGENGMPKTSDSLDSRCIYLCTHIIYSIILYHIILRYIYIYICACPQQVRLWDCGERATCSLSLSLSLARSPSLPLPPALLRDFALKVLHVAGLVHLGFGLFFYRPRQLPMQTSSAGTPPSARWRKVWQRSALLRLLSFTREVTEGVGVIVARIKRP